LPGTVPLRRTALARVKIVFTAFEGVEVGVFVGVRETSRFVGVKRETVFLLETGVNGRADVSEHI